ncbi:hypothetical protein PR202_ga23868 [Eleusine coracana subsp. coracana]|uniref:Leucine-rich repeat-containing N-terminal plant-type domain-containing protein n=1 Tax=Eleusine coracana subsp. coracana TaxID=191504 RepID=A0AAV5D6C8_ELECO|nr:hypothetical protein PR202_ga23868 [Eleusine coracana subsp. coracana]
MCERPRRRYLFPVGALIRSSQLLTILAFSSLWSCAIPASTPASNNDFETLICLKLHLSTSAGPLDSWNRSNSLHFCSWAGVTCSKARTSHVIALVLESSGLDGQIPTCIGNLTLVTKIHFPNNQLKGVIPPELGQLRRLRYLNLSSNSLTGTIPSTLSSTSLQVIDLGTNSLHGEIPEAFGMLSNISVLNLAGNRLTGNIPLSLVTSSSLVSLVLRNNSLTGSIPSALVHSSSLEVLDLTRNTLGGVIPPGLFNSTSLQRLSLGWNYFVGSIPSVPSIIDSPLQSLVLSVNELTGTIPSSLGNFSSLRRLLLADNKFQGSIPASLSQLPNLQELDMSYNNLSGTVPASLYNMSSLIDLRLAMNRFTGSIPSDIGNTLTSIRTLIFQENNFEGQIPPSLANATNLESINLAQNAFHGIIPSFGSLSKLKQLILAANHLEAGDWTFLSSLTNCTKLEELALAINMMQVLIISSNNAEYGFGNKISTEGDVYSYGILILEMLTGKRPTDELFSNGLSLHKFVGDAFPERTSEILDPNIIRSLGDEGLDNKADKENHAAAGLLGSITQLIKVGLSCSMEAPKDRPTMLEVYAEVNAIKQSISAVCVE